MYWQVTCQSCGKGLRMREEHIGRRVRCPYCRREFLAKPPEQGPEPRTVVPTTLPRAVGGPRTVEVPTIPPAALEAPPAAPPPRAPASTLIRPPGTNVSVLLTGAAAAGATALFYILLVIPFRKTYFGQLLAARGWVQYGIMFLSFWAAAVLILKSRKISRQKDSLLFDMLPSDISYEIRPDNVDVFRAHIRGLPCDPRDSFLMNRCLRALDHFKSRRAAQEVADLLQSQAEIDAAAVDSSYAMVRVFIWAIPILGFIGTVVGIGQAVSGFSASLAGEADLTALKASLSGVTRGLSVAFDTTFLALVMSLIVMFPMSSMHKREEDMLISVADYCNENLLRRLYEGGEGAPAADPLRVKEAVTSAVGEHEARLQQACARLDAIGEGLVRRMVGGWEAINAQLGDHLGRQIDAVHARLADACKERGELLSQMGSMQESQVKRLVETLATMTDAANRTADRVAEWQRSHLATLRQLQASLDTIQRAGAGGPGPSGAERFPAPAPARSDGWLSRLFRRKPRNDAHA